MTSLIEQPSTVLGIKICLRLLINLNDVVVYDKKNSLVKSIAPVVKSKNDLNEVVQKLEEPKAVVQQLTDKYG